MISCSFARISDAISGMRAAISSGIETTPWTSAYSRSPERIAKSEDLDRGSEIDDVHVGVGDGDGRSEHRELHPADPGNVADRAIGDHAFAVEGLQNRRVHLANGRGAAGGCIQILEDGNPGHGQEADRLPPIRAIDVGVARHRRVRGSHPAGGRVAEKARRAPVTHRRPGRVKPSLRSRTPKCSIALAIVQVSNCRMPSKVACGSGCRVVAAGAA